MTHIGGAGGRRIERVVDHRRWVGARGMGDQRHGDAVGPHAQLVDGRGAERVGGGEEDPRAARLEAIRELGDGRGLARPVDADDEHDGRHAGAGLRGHGTASRVAKRPRSS